MKKLRGFTLIELLIVVAIIAILAAIAVPNFLEAQTRSKVSRVRSDHRALATAIEAYYIDYNQYPAATKRLDLGHDTDVLANATNPQNRGATFARKAVNSVADPGANSLTTPVSYISTIFNDPFSSTNGISYRYWTDGRGWIVGSYGPNSNEAQGGNLRWDDFSETGKGYAARPGATRQGSGIETFYNSADSQPSILLLTGTASPITGGGGPFATTYDPTNGTTSPGDVWRVRQ